MHLLLLNVVPLLWRMFSGELGAHGDEPSNLVVSASVVADTGRELRDARHTAPRSQARSLRNLAKSFRSYKAVDWMYFLMCTGGVVQADRILPPMYSMVMHLVRSCRLLFRPRGLSIEDLQSVESGLKSFCRDYYELVYGRDLARLPLCRSTIAAVLDVASNIRS